MFSVSTGEHFWIYSIIPLSLCVAVCSLFCCHFSTLIKGGKDKALHFQRYLASSESQDGQNRENVGLLCVMIILCCWHHVYIALKFEETTMRGKTLGFQFITRRDCQRQWAAKILTHLLQNKINALQSCLPFRFVINK